MAITVNSRVPFGSYKNKRVRDCPDTFLQWCIDKLLDTDLHEYAIVAKEVLKDRSGDGHLKDLEAEADAFLRQHGVQVDKNGNII